ncbi:MAG TPA: methionine--tRNA ligase [Candidatus Cybelea sp.]|nr:methionine--tRNA ligase [Candidatus Cybelea sp.]
MEKQKYYLTTPIYYANSRPHVGSAYTTIVCDVIARYRRMCGSEVAYTTGTDEHGVNIERAAEKAGITPQELVDRNQKIFIELWKLLGIHYTDFVRTTSVEHARAVQILVRRTLRRSPHAIYKAKYEGRYCIYDNLYVSDSPEPADCPICGRPAELISEENYFFRLSAFQQRLLDLYEQHPEFVRPDFRLNEARSFVEAGLKDVSISRKSIKWGIPWPDDPEHVFYVWYDALTSYMTAIGFGEGHEGDANPKFRRFWPADVHMIGKEIIRFHAVYWPAFLMAAELPLPKQIFAHGWLLFEQEKMSKSRGNVAYPEPIVKGLDQVAGAKVGNDALRYYLLRETVFGQDGNFSREALITRYNADLANGLGNLASRVLTMISQYLSGVLPDSPSSEATTGGDLEIALEGHAADTCKIARDCFDRFDFSGALGQIWSLVGQTDQLLSLAKPWALAGEENRRRELERVLRRAAEALRIAAVLSHPVIPEATEKIWEQLGETAKLADVRIDELGWAGLKPGTRIGKPGAVFPRLDKKQAWERIEAMEQEIRGPGASAPAGTASGETASAGAAKITIDDFQKIELRAGVIQSAERIPGADKLLKILVDIGGEVRQVLAGVATSYAAENLAGMKVVVVTNLAPRKMRGLESNGMLLAASTGPDGKPVLCTFAEEVSPGAKVR